MDEPRLVIIGGGIAGLTAAESARATNPSVGITMVSNEPQLPYNRLNLTKFIAMDTDEARLILRDEAWYADRRIAVVRGEVASIDRKEKSISLAEGQRLSYDKLILATGATPFIPPIPGAGLKGVLSLRTLSDANAILRGTREGTRCACIGGGLLGIELAAGLRKRGADITILEASGWPLSRQLAKPGGIMLREHINGLGIGIICGAKVREIVGADKAEGLRLETGEFIGCDLVLISAGVRPNIMLAKGCGLETGRGLKVDDRMATSDQDIFGAGDVAEHGGTVHGLWPIAVGQGSVAGTNAAGGDVVYKPVPPPAILKVVGLDVFSIGDFSPEGDDAKIHEEIGDGRYLRLAVRSGAIIGANMVGDISAARLVKNAVEKRVQINSADSIVKRFPHLAAGTP